MFLRYCEFIVFIDFQAYVFMLLRVHYRIHGHELQRAQCKMGLLQVPILAGDP